MITREELETALEDGKAFVTKNIDHDVKVINLLRERIPYEECKSIISGAEHDILYLCDVDEALPHLTVDDLNVLADCNVLIDDNTDSLALYV